MDYMYLWLLENNNLLYEKTVDWFIFDLYIVIYLVFKTVKITCINKNKIVLP